MLANWNTVVEDAAATTDEYRDVGWEVVEIYPGNIALMSGEHENVDRYGLDLVVPAEDA